MFKSIDNNIAFRSSRLGRGDKRSRGTIKKC